MKLIVKTTDVNIIESLLNTYKVIFESSQNMHWIHWHAKGPKFDRIHALADEYYDKLVEETDVIVEMCLKHGVEITNPLMLNSSNVLSKIDINYDESINMMRDILNNLIIALNDLSSIIENRGDQSVLDDILAYWDKELNYKMDRRL